MDYEKKYNEALERAKNIKSKILQSHLSTESCKAVSEYIDEIIPELRESEDERIRKVIYKLMLGMREEIFTSQDEIVTKEKALAYLEKKPDIKIWPHEIIDAKNGEHDPADIYSEDGRLIAKKDESEDERIRKKIIDIVKAAPFDEEKDVLLGWLEKQKEQSLRDFIDDFPYSDQKEQKELPLMDGNADLYFDEWNQQKQNPTKRQCFEEGIRYAQRLQKEQKPNSTEDMPYITDEHFYEREPVDSFKYKLAEYMTRCCTKKEGPYGYEYGISAESILKMAEEELLKRGVVQKPAEWSEEDEKIMDSIINELGQHYKTCTSRDCPSASFSFKAYQKEIDWLKSLRPSWKPSEEQMNCLCAAVDSAIRKHNESVSGYKPARVLKTLYEQLQNL